MKKNKKRLFIKNRFESMINKENIIKEFKSRGSYRIVVGTIPNRFCKENGRVIIEAFIEDLVRKILKFYIHRLQFKIVMMLF